MSVARAQWHITVRFFFSETTGSFELKYVGAHWHITVQSFSQKPLVHSNRKKCLKKMSMNICSCFPYHSYLTCGISMWNGSIIFFLSNYQFISEDGFRRFYDGCHINKWQHTFINDTSIMLKNLLGAKSNKSMKTFFFLS